MGAAVGEQSAGTASPRQAGDPAPPRPRTELRRVTVHEHDDRNGCETVRGVGFSWRCTCGAKAEKVKPRPVTVAEQREHERGHRAP